MGIGPPPGRQTILCLEYDLTDEEALRWLIQSHRPSRGLNSYSRALLALDLEPCLQERERAKQQAGGQSKGSSHLTEAHRMDVRSEIALIAGVSKGKCYEGEATEGDGSSQTRAGSTDWRN